MERETLFTVLIILGVISILFQLMGLSTNGWLRIYDHDTHSMSEVGLWNTPECMDTNETDCGPVKIVYSDNGYVRVSPYLAAAATVLTLVGLVSSCAVWKGQMSPTYELSTTLGRKVVFSSVPLYVAGVLTLVVITIQSERISTAQSQILALNHLSTQLLFPWSLLLFGLGATFCILAAISLSCVSCMSTEKWKRSESLAELNETELGEDE